MQLIRSECLLTLNINLFLIRSQALIVLSEPADHNYKFEESNAIALIVSVWPTNTYNFMALSTFQMIIFMSIPPDAATDIYSPKKESYKCLNAQTSP